MFARMPSTVTTGPLRLAYIAVVTFIACGWCGIWLVSGHETSNQVDAVIRVSSGVDWANPDLNGPLFDAENYEEALYSAIGREPTSPEVESLRASMKVKTNRGGTGKTAQIRLLLRTSRPSVSRRVIDHLSQMAISRLNATQFQMERSRIVDLANAELNSAQQRENAAQAAFEQFVSGWLDDEAHRPAAEPATMAQIEPPKQMVNPAWQELASKRDRLELRMEDRLETHRRKHPAVRRLQSEIERATRLLTVTERELPAVAKAQQLGLREVERKPVGPTWTIAARHQHQTDLKERRRRYAELRDDWHSAKINRLRLVSRLSSHGSDDDAAPQTMAWIEQPAIERRPPSPQSSRLGLLLLASAIASVTMVAFQITIDRQGLGGEGLLGEVVTSGTESDSSSSRQANLATLHGVALLVCETAAAAIAITAVVALAVGETDWMAVVGEKLRNGLR